MLALLDLGLEFTPLEFETATSAGQGSRAKALEFTPLEFETEVEFKKVAVRLELEFTPLEFETRIYEINAFNQTN